MHKVQRLGNKAYIKYRLLNLDIQRYKKHCSRNSKTLVNEDVEIANRIEMQQKSIEIH